MPPFGPFLSKRTKRKGKDYVPGPNNGKEEDNHVTAAGHGMDIALLGSAQGISLSNQLERFLATTHFGMVLDVANVILSLLSFILYVHEAQQKQGEDPYETQNDGALFKVRNVLNIFFILDYLLHLFAARKKLRFIFSYHGMIDLITVLPNLLADMPGISSALAETCFNDCERGQILQLFKVAGYACAAASTPSDCVFKNCASSFEPSACVKSQCSDELNFDLFDVGGHLDASGFCLDEFGHDYGLGKFSTPKYYCLDNCNPFDIGDMIFGCERYNLTEVTDIPAVIRGGCFDKCGTLSDVLATGTFEEICDTLTEEEKSMRLKCVLRSIAVTLPLLRILRLQRALKLVGYDGMFSLSDLNHQAMSFLLTVVSMIAVSSGMIHWAEHMTHTCMVTYFAHKDSCGDPIEFPSWAESVYMIVMTITTVGYGDFVPRTNLGKIFIVFQMITTLIVIPRETNKILSIIANTSSYSRYKYRPSSAIHVVVCGALQSSGVSDFFVELFHSDHGNADLMAVALAKGLPSGEMMSIIGDPKYAFNIVYLDGDPMKEKDLKRAAISTSDAVFILTDKFSHNIKEDDAMTILTNLSIKQYVMQQHHRDILVCMQLIRPDATHLLTGASVMQKKELNQNNKFVCIDEIKMSVMAKSCLCPGITTMIHSLVSSSRSAPNSDNESWLGEYSAGCAFEVYCIPISPAFSGCSFVDAARIVYQETESLLFALEVNPPDALSRLMINPAEYRIPDTIDYSVYGFVLATDVHNAEVLTDGSRKDVDQLLSELGPHAEGHRRRSGGVSVDHPSTRRRTRNSVIIAGQNLLGIASAESKIEGKRRQTSLNLSYTNLKRNDVKRDSIALHLANSKMKQEEKPDSLTSEDIKNRRNRRGSVGQANWKILRESYLHVVQKGDDIRDLDEQSLYHTLPRSAHLEDVTIPSSLDGPTPIVGHIIVIGNLVNLDDFIKPLRSTSLQIVRPIVLLQPRPPSKEVWATISHFSDVYYVKGSHLNLDDLHRAGVQMASCAVIFPKEVQSNQTSMQGLVDADTIFTYRMISKANPQINITCELVTQSNIGFLKTTSSKRDMARNKTSPSSSEELSPCFAAGQVFITSLLDTLICQAYYNTHIIDIVKLVVGGVDPIAVQMWNHKMKHKIGAAIDSQLFLIGIPTKYCNKTYFDLFKYLVGYGMVPMGLRRGVMKKLKIGRQGNILPYVLTNPKKDTMLSKDDSVYVLAQAVPEGFLESFDETFAHVMENAKKSHRTTSFDNDESEVNSDDEGGTSNSLHSNEAALSPRATQSDKLDGFELGTAGGSRPSSSRSRASSVVGSARSRTDYRSQMENIQSISKLRDKVQQSIGGLQSDISDLDTKVKMLSSGNAQ